MDQFCKTAITIFFVFTSLATAYYFEDEPSLVNENLRLAALGNLNFILEEYGNEINIYDFGELSAGIIEDDSGKSSLCIRSTYGFDNTLEISSETDWTGGTIAVSGIYKRMKQWAIGGSFSGLKRELGFYSPWEMNHVRYDIQSTWDTAVVALHVLEWVSLGLRGVYHRDMMKTSKYINYWESDETTWTVDPSVSITLPWGKWFIGFGYTYTDFGYYPDADNAKAVIFPVVFRGSNLTIGIKAKHELTYRSDGYMSDKETYGGIQSIYRIPIHDKTINIGAIIDRDITYQYWEYGVPIYNWFMDYGAGIALVDKNLGLVGMQIQRRIYHRYATAYPKQTIFNLGLEVKPLKNTPIRLGYIYHTWDTQFPYSYQNVITMGFGHNFSERAMIDFAYNFRIGSTEWYPTLQPAVYHDTQHLFSVSGRYTF
jgi:hypothetical protein